MPVDKTALNATKLPRSGKAKMKANMHKSHTSEEPKGMYLRTSSALAIPFHSEEHEEKGGTATIGGVPPTVDFWLETRTLGTHRHGKMRTSGMS